MTDRPFVGLATFLLSLQPEFLVTTSYRTKTEHVHGKAMITVWTITA